MLTPPPPPPQGPSQALNAQAEYEKLVENIYAVTAEQRQSVADTEAKIEAKIETDIEAWKTQLDEWSTKFRREMEDKA